MTTKLKFKEAIENLTPVSFVLPCGSTVTVKPRHRGASGDGKRYFNIHIDIHIKDELPFAWVEGYGIFGVSSIKMRMSEKAIPKLITLLTELGKANKEVA